jgi:hypothetical protein
MLRSSPGDDTGQDRLQHGTTSPSSTARADSSLAGDTEDESDGASPATATAEAGLEPDIAPSKLSIEVTTDPPGAAVHVDGTFACKSPCDAELPTKGGLVEGRLAGYRAEKHRVEPPISGPLELTLRKRPSPRPPEKATGGSGTKAPPPPLLER